MVNISHTPAARGSGPVPYREDAAREVESTAPAQPADRLDHVPRTRTQSPAAIDAGGALRPGQVGGACMRRPLSTGSSTPELSTRELDRILPRRERPSRALLGDIARIQRDVLPRVGRAVSAFHKGDRTVDDRVCHRAAALARVALLDAGFPQESIHLTYNRAHVYLRVDTEHGELIVDPTFSQFFDNGTAVDRSIQERGGFVGTRAEMERFFARHHHAVVGLAESSKFANYPPEARSDELALGLWAQDIMPMLLHDHDATMERTYLSDQSEKIVADYHRWVADGCPEPDPSHDRQPFDYAAAFRILEHK